MRGVRSTRNTTFALGRKNKNWEKIGKRKLRLNFAGLSEHHQERERERGKKRRLRLGLASLWYAAHKGNFSGTIRHLGGQRRKKTL